MVNKMVFKARNYTLELNEAKVMAVINLTPDSFYEGSRFNPSDAVKHAVKAVEEGAAIIDIGAQSTAPASKPITAEEELERLISPLTAIRSAVDVPISVDTFFSSVAQAALKNGADIINDVSGKSDGVMSTVAAQYSAGHIIMHTGGLSSRDIRTDSADITEEINSFFLKAITAAEKAGLNKENICLDPGIGFGKSRKDDMKIITDFCKLDKLGCASLAGLSRKRITKLCGDALTGTVIFNTRCILGGANIIRVHDVVQGIASVKAAQMILKGI